ncbi:MAG TPA: DUF3108 domain-containing protein [Pyrinomonadaceae bacterium]|nr:DUF3108 domain-containing protein [Pyrinomonadaceae bacterium]
MTFATKRGLAAFTFLVLMGSIGICQTGKRERATHIPFQPGETLVYEAKISKIIRGIAVADLTLTVGDSPDEGLYIVRADAKSKGTLLKIARYSFVQELESTIGSREFRILKTVKHDVQKDRIRDSEAEFDYDDRRVTYTESDPREPMRPPRRIASELDGTTHDFVSGIYSLRLLPLTVGGTYVIKISDSGLVYDIPIKVTAREKQKSIFGSVMCFRLEPDVFGPRRLIEKEGSMVIWITDDARRIPIRSQVNAPFGKVEIKLKSAKKLK